MISYFVFDKKIATNADMDTDTDADALAGFTIAHDGKMRLHPRDDGAGQSGVNKSNRVSAALCTCGCHKGNEERVVVPLFSVFEGNERVLRIIVRAPSLCTKSVGNSIFTTPLYSLLFRFASWRPFNRH